MPCSRPPSADGSRPLRLARCWTGSWLCRFDSAPPWPCATPSVSASQNCQLSSYDAAYVDLAMRSGMTLATQDQAMAKAARHLGLAVFGEA